MWSASSAHAGGGYTAPARTLRVVVPPILFYFKLLLFIIIILFFKNCIVVLHLMAARDSHVGLANYI